jgi:hypothetical protein
MGSLIRRSIVMKKLVIATAVVAFASIVTAQVTSQNIVGYTKVTVDGGDLALVALNFNSPTTLQDVIGTAVPSLSVVYKWDKGTSAYVSSSLNKRGSWNPNLTLDIGDAFFIEPAGSGPNEIIVPGEVLTTDATITYVPGVTASGIYFPVQQNFQSTDTADALPPLSVVYTWDEVGQGYLSISKNKRSVWSGNPVINPADGFFVDNPEATNVVVTETVPFTP